MSAKATGAPSRVGKAAIAAQKTDRPPKIKRKTRVQVETTEAVSIPTDPHFISGSSRGSSTGASSAVRARVSQTAKLPKEFAWYEKTTGLSAPEVLRKGAADAHEMFFDFSVDRTTEGIWGSGVHLGGGLVLTAFHVVLGIRRDGELPIDRRFQGDGPSDWFQRWQIKMLPTRGCFGLNGAGEIEPQLQAGGTFNDFAIVKAPEAVGRRAIKAIRATKDLAPGEPVWAIGDKTGGKIRVDAGTFAEDQSRAIPGTAIIKSSDLEAGFSGSPAIDNRGNLVGVIFATDDKISMMVRSETLVELVLETQRAHRTPLAKLIGF